MKSINQVQLIGNVTRDPELRTTPSGQSIVNLSLALNRSYKDKNSEWQEATDYVTVVCWGSLAERINQYVKKGSRIYVGGRIQSRSWEQDGQKRYATEVLASDVMFLDGKTNTSEVADRAPAPASNDEIDLSEIPF